MKLGCELTLFLPVVIFHVACSNETAVDNFTESTQWTETVSWTTPVATSTITRSSQRERSTPPLRRRSTKPTGHFGRRRPFPGFSRHPADRPQPGSGFPRPLPEYPRPNFGSRYGNPDTGHVTAVTKKNTTQVDQIHAECFDNYMRVTIQLNGSFNGLVYSAGYSHDRSCSYVNGSGRFHYEFYIRLNRCGTLGRQEILNQGRATAPDRAQHMINTITIQYNPLIEEEWDEHFRVVCEYGYEFWKTVTFPVFDVETNTGRPVVFTLPPPQCNMEIRHGYGPSGLRIGGPVSVGDPLTILIHMKSETSNFDIVVSNCIAHNGANKRLQLIDEHGCVIQEKLVSSFRGISNPEHSPQLTLYSYLKAFRFTGSPALYLECDVRMCHGHCPPQRCYWRNIYKRSAAVSESVSLFHSLEVQSGEKLPSAAGVRGVGDTMHRRDAVCLQTTGFTVLLSALLLVLLVMALTSVCLCVHIHKLKVGDKSVVTNSHHYPGSDHYSTKMQ